MKPELVSYSMIGFFVLSIFCMGVAFTTSLSMKKTRILCWTGLLSFFFVGIHAAYLHFWHEFLR